MCSETIGIHTTVNLWKRKDGRQLATCFDARMLEQSHCRVPCDRPTEIEGMAFNRATEKWPHSTLFCSHKQKIQDF